MNYREVDIILDGVIWTFKSLLWTPYISQITNHCQSIPLEQNKHTFLKDTTWGIPQKAWVHLPTQILDILNPHTLKHHPATKPANHPARWWTEENWRPRWSQNTSVTSCVREPGLAREFLCTGSGRVPIIQVTFTSWRHERAYSILGLLSDLL